MNTITITIPNEETGKNETRTVIGKPKFREIACFNLKLMNFSFGEVLVGKKGSNIPGFLNGKFGGAYFGKNHTWAGIAHTLPILFYLYKDVENTFWVNVRIAEKIVMLEDGTEKTYPQIWVRNPHTHEDLPEYYAYYVQQYTKDVIYYNGFHRHQKLITDISNVSILCESTTMCRSSRYGNDSKIIYSPTQIELEYSVV